MKKQTNPTRTPSRRLLPALALLLLLLAAILAVRALLPRVRQEEVLISSQRSGQPVELHATAWWPEGVRSAPLVLLCHGFTGNRQGDGHFAPLAARLAEYGIASIAVDFPGNGESEEPFTAYTIEAMQSDLRAAAVYMAQQHGADTGRLGLVGHSMGGRLVTLSLSEQVTAAALWSPADNTGLDGIEFLDHTAEGRQALLETARAQGSAALPQWGVTVGRDFLEEMAVSDPAQALRQYHGRLLVAFSGGDPELLSQQTIDLTLQAAAQGDPDFVNLYGLFENATHNYNAISQDAQENRDICTRLEEQTALFLRDALRR